LPTDRPRNRRSARVPAERTIRSVAFTKCPTRAARSCRFRSRALRVLRDHSRANADFVYAWTRLPVPASGPYALLNAGPVHAVPCPAKLSALGQPQCIVRFWMRTGSRGGLKDGNRPPREGQADPRRRRRADDLHADRGLLGELGYTVAAEAAGIEEALEATKNADFDLGIFNAGLNGPAPPSRLPKPSLPAALPPAVPRGWAKANAAERARVAVSQ
jgi:hypothetical protein